MEWQTTLGTMLDPVADKLLLSGTIFILWMNQFIPFYIFVILLENQLKIALSYCIVFLNAFIAKNFLNSILMPPSFFISLITFL